MRPVYFVLEGPVDAYEAANAIAESIREAESKLKRKLPEGAS